MTNPYDPQNPVNPHYFGGRKHILKIVEERIERAKKQQQPGSVLICGHRGVGKTSLMKKIMSIADPDRKEKNVLAIYRRLAKTTSDSELYQIITESIIEEIDSKRSTAQKIKKAAKNIKSAKVGEIELNINKQDLSEKTPYHKLQAVIRSLKNVDFILVAIDDADYFSIEAIGELKSIVEEQNKPPILLAVSGGVEFETKLTDDYSPIARIFSGADFNIGEFSTEETKEVLEKPLQNRDTEWKEEAINKVQELSKGYPYLVQCIASASYIEKGTITAELVSSKIEDALELGRPWLNNEVKNASDIDMQSFSKICGLDKEIIKSSEMNNLGILPIYIGRLVQHKIIERISRGRYKLKKPPIIALYHKLKRNLK